MQGQSRVLPPAMIDRVGVAIPRKNHLFNELYRVVAKTFNTDLVRPAQLIIQFLLSSVATFDHRREVLGVHVDPRSVPQSVRPDRFRLPAVHLPELERLYYGDRDQVGLGTTQHLASAPFQILVTVFIGNCDYTQYGL